VRQKRSHGRRTDIGSMCRGISHFHLVSR
jgi:hypothetical protein